MVPALRFCTVTVLVGLFTVVEFNSLRSCQENTHMSSEGRAQALDPAPESGMACLEGNTERDRMGGTGSVTGKTTDLSKTSISPTLSASRELQKKECE